MNLRRLLPASMGGALLLAVAACGDGAPSDSTASSRASPTARSSDPAETPPQRRERSGEDPVVIGPPIAPADLSGRIAFDDFEDVFTMNVDGSDPRTVAGGPGSEFDAAWAPDGGRIVYRDSTRGINVDDEIFLVNPDGTGARNLSAHPANDWGPDWSPDGAWIGFNSDRDGGALAAYLVRPDGSDLHRLPIDGWVEYLSFSPDGARIVFMRPAGGDYDIYAADVATGETTRLTDAPGDDGWPVWSPDGSLIAFSSERDDCVWASPDADCWQTGEPGEHHDVWLMRPDGTEQRRVSPEYGQFVAWSPDGNHLLISGHTLFVVRTDGSGRIELRPEGATLPPGGIPDWTP